MHCITLFLLHWNSPAASMAAAVGQQVELMSWAEFLEVPLVLIVQVKKCLCWVWLKRRMDFMISSSVEFFMTTYQSSSKTGDFRTTGEPQWMRPKFVSAPGSHLSSLPFLLHFSQKGQQFMVIFLILSFFSRSLPVCLCVYMHACMHVLQGPSAISHSLTLHLPLVMKITLSKKQPQI